MPSNDALNGGAGADSLIGGTGNDTYWLGRGYGADSITENDATVGITDAARFDIGVATDQLWFRHVGNNLEVSVIGTSDMFTMTNWYWAASTTSGIQDPRWQELAGQSGAKFDKCDSRILTTSGGADHVVCELCYCAYTGDCGELAVARPT